MNEAEYVERTQAPPGYHFLGWYLPSVKMVFASPSKGLEDRFVPVFMKDEQ